MPSLTRGSRWIELAPKALEILSVLVSNAGDVVRKDDILALVWPHAITYPLLVEPALRTSVRKDSCIPIR